MPRVYVLASSVASRVGQGEQGNASLIALNMPRYLVLNQLGKQTRSLGSMRVKPILACDSDMRFCTAGTDGDDQTVRDNQAR